AKELIYGALEGMLASLDDYSQFLEPESYKELKEDTKGEFGGLGLEIGLRDGMLTVISPISDTPAEKAGIMPGDIVVKIDGEVTRQMSLADAVKKMRGKPGTGVTLTIWREKEDKFFDVVIVRDIISVKSVREARMLGGGIAYVKIAEFQETSGNELEKSLSAMKRDDIKGIIIDLRNNAGGLLDSAIDVSDLFLEKGELIVSTKGRISEEDREYISEKETVYGGIPLAVLINEGSASASEIVAGAVRDNNKGVLVGKKTFGKGSVQTVIPLKDGSALRITSAEYFTPNGTSIDKKGISPDVEIEYRKLDNPDDDSKAEQVFERLEGKTEAADNDERDIMDTQIKAAMDAIKTVNIMRAGK
ncbi:MAG: S41 family peptidase, partial [Candidatus Omnitrophota bacterium]